MSRIIKFRAWNKTSSKWMNLKDCIDIDNYGGVYPFVRTDKAEIELMQYTGLKDRLGIEIYEGDIVTGTVGGSSDGSSYTEVVISLVNFKREGYWSLIQYNDDGELEVIGNIYENSDLPPPKTLTS